MKYSIAALFTLIVCFSAYVLAQEFKGPLENVLKEKLNLSADEFKKQCESQSKYTLEEILRSRASASKIGNDLADDVVSRAKELPKVDENNWNKLIYNRCYTNVTMKHFTELSVDKINLCFDEKNRLTGGRRNEFTDALFTGYCSAVKTLAEEKYEKTITK